MVTMQRNKFITFVVLCLVLCSCSQEKKETPTKGFLSVLVGESVAPVIGQVKEKFEELYKQAKIDITVMPTREALVQFFNQETTQVIIASRPLNQEEQEVARRSNLEFREYKIAIDAVAIIVNKKNPVAKLRTTELDSILRGIISSWKTFGWDKKDSKIEICIPHQNSATFETITVKVLRGQQFGKVSAMATTSLEMIQYVSTHANALGMVGLGWLQAYRDTVKVLELSDPFSPESLGIGGQYFAPFQAHVYRGYYPLTREVFIYSRADNYGIGAGFIAFTTSAVGQKIFLRNGLVPATMPVRLVEITNKELKQ